MNTSRVDDPITCAPQGISLDTGVPGAPLPKRAQKGDSIHSAAPAKNSSSWSYMKIAVVSLCVIVACTVAGWVMTVFFQDADRAEAFQRQRDYYKSRLYKN